MPTPQWLAQLLPARRRDSDSPALASPARPVPLPNEQELVALYTGRLLELARYHLPATLRRRIDPEDVVQSVYRSFFQRLQEGRFSFDEAGQLWRLLAVMTFQKAREAGKFHQRQRRNVRRDRSLHRSASNDTGELGPIDLQPGPEDLTALVECLDDFMAQLPDKYREIVVHRLEGDSVEQIAVKVNRSARTVFRALSELEKLASQRTIG